MFLKITYPSGSALTFWKEDDGTLHAEEYQRVNRLRDEENPRMRRVWRRVLTPEQATELRVFLASQGF